jgi:hypothetical protein
MTCGHKTPIYSAYEEVEISPWGDTELQLVEKGGAWTYEDIGIGAFRCTQCNLVQYYTGSWRKFYETGEECPSSSLVSDSEIKRVRKAAKERK